MKRKLGIIIQARLSSKRLPRKVVLNFFNNQSILDIILNKLQVFKNQYDIVHDIRTQQPVGLKGGYHSFAKKKLICYPFLKK